jgi:hypothetical protein
LQEASRGWKGGERDGGKKKARKRGMGEGRKKERKGWTEGGSLTGAVAE